jgi:hypothetical protein
MARMARSVASCDIQTPMRTHRDILIAVMLALISGPAYSQSKSACQLMADSSLRAITGFDYSEPRSVPVEEKLLPLRALPPVIASSSCIYGTTSSSVAKFNNGVRLTVWQMQRADAENAKSKFFRELESNFQGRDEVQGLPYPSVQTAIGNALYIFKGGDELTILKVQILGAPTEASLHSPSAYPRELLAQQKKIALAALGTAAPLPGRPSGPVSSAARLAPNRNAPSAAPSNDQILDDDDSLRGQNALAIRVVIDGMRDIPESTFRSDIVDELEPLGITVLPNSEPPQHPYLVLIVTAQLARLVNDIPFTTFSITLDFQQLFPLPGAGTRRYVDARTWSAGEFGALPSIKALEIRGIARKLVTRFAVAYRRANSN